MTTVAFPLNFSRYTFIKIILTKNPEENKIFSPRSQSWNYSLHSAALNNLNAWLLRIRSSGLLSVFISIVY